MPKVDTRYNDLIFGVHPILEVLKAKQRKMISIYTTKPVPKCWPEVEKNLPKRPINIQYVDKHILTRMAGTEDHMNILAWVSSFPFRKKMFEPEKAPLILLLDSIQDVRNLGAIIRSAYCANFDGIVMCRGKSAPLTAAAIKASAGLAEHMPIYVASSIGNAISELKKSSYNLFMATLDPAGKDARDVPFTRPSCLVIGNESHGISKDVQKKGMLVTIPQRSKNISYNASVAAGIMMFLASYSKQS